MKDVFFAFLVLKSGRGFLIRKETIVHCHFTGTDSRFTEIHHQTFKHVVASLFGLIVTN